MARKSDCTILLRRSRYSNRVVSNSNKTITKPLLLNTAVTLKVKYFDTAKN